eukprot:gene1566-16017_t
MTWDDELARGSKEWAMKLAGENGLRHSRGNYGENLYAAWGQTANCAKATLAWYNEIKDYNFNRGVTVPSLREIESGITPPSTNRPQPPKPPTERPLPPTDRPLPPTERPLPPTERPLPPTNPPQPSSNLCLHAHNVLRALHQNTGPMTWDDELARGSKEWAMKLAGENGLRHSRGNYGENLYAAWGQTANCAKATLAWYNEIKDYNFNRGARVPSLRELESGVTAPATDGPRPPVPATEQPLPPSRTTQAAAVILGGNADIVTGFVIDAKRRAMSAELRYKLRFATTYCKDMFTNCGVYRRKCNSNSWIRNRCKKTCNTC